MPEEHGVPKAQRRKQVNTREQMQIKHHQERVTGGRELRAKTRGKSLQKKLEAAICTGEAREDKERDGRV